MKNNAINTKYVTEAVFNKAIKKNDVRFDKLDAKIDSVEKRLDSKIDGVITALVKTQQDVDEIKRTMSTKNDVQMILDKIDDFVGQNRKTDMEQKVQSFQIKELKEISSQHEKRIAALESNQS